MQIKLIDTLAKFDEVENEWTNFELVSSNTNINSSYAWVRTWWRVFGDLNIHKYGSNKQLKILFLYDDQLNLRAISPFCLVKRKVNKLFSYRAIEFISQQWAASFIDLLSLKLTKEELNYIFAWLKKNVTYDIINLRYIPATTTNFNIQDSHSSVISGCPELLGDSYPEVKKTYYSKNLRHKLRRINNKINRENVSITFGEHVGNDVIRGLEEIASISKSKEYSGKHSIYNDPHKRLFMKSVMETFSTQSRCILLRYNEEICAYNLGCFYGPMYYAIDASYNRNSLDLKNFSIGNLVYDATVKTALNEGATAFSFGTGIDSYKLRFTKRIVKIYAFLFKGNTLFSFYFHFLVHQMNKKREKIFNNEFAVALPELNKKTEGKKHL